MKTKIYIPVSVEDELPTICKEYFTNLGEVFFYPTDKPHFSKKVSWWLKEIELDIPTDEDAQKEFREYHFKHKSNFTSRGEYFTHAFRWLREQITNQLKNK